MEPRPPLTCVCDHEDGSENPLLELRRGQKPRISLRDEKAAKKLLTNLTNPS